MYFLSLKGKKTLGLTMLASKGGTPGMPGGRTNGETRGCPCGLMFGIAVRITASK